MTISDHHSTSGIQATDPALIWSAPPNIPPEILLHAYFDDLGAATREGEPRPLCPLFPDEHRPALRWRLEHSDTALAEALAIHTLIHKSGVSIDALAVAAGADWKQTQAWHDLTPRKQRKETRKAFEAVALAARLVGGDPRNKQRICSAASRGRRGAQLARQDQWLSEHAAVDTVTGQSFELPCTDRKRKKGLAEVQTYCSGFDPIIEQDQLEFAAVIISARGEWHSNPLNTPTFANDRKAAARIRRLRRTHKINQRDGATSWNGQLPDETSRWFADGWQHVRSRLAKFDITQSGIQTGEGNQDGTPHKNYLVIFPKGEAAQVERAFREVFGHSKNAVKFTPGNGAAKFSTYATKYFNKHFNGWGVDEAADAEETTAAAFGFRRRNFFGLPPLSLWREMRRLRDCPTEAPPALLAAWKAANGCPSDPEAAAAGAWRAARRGDAATFFRLCGGLACKRSQRPIRTWREPVEGMKTEQVVGVMVMESAEIPEVKLNGRSYRSGGVKTPKRSSSELTNGTPFTRLDRVKHYKIALTTICDLATAVRIRTRTPGRFNLVAKPNIQENPLVIVKVNYPRGGEPPPKQTQDPPPGEQCTAREYALATS